MGERQALNAKYAGNPIMTGVGTIQIVFCLHGPTYRPGIFLAEVGKLPLTTRLLLCQVVAKGVLFPVAGIFNGGL
jgi:hypothetical protein